MKDSDVITINNAVELRIRELLSQRKMSQYRLEQNSGISHSQMSFILKNRNNSVNFKTIIMLANGFGMKVIKFFDSPYFNNLDIE